MKRYFNLAFTVVCVLVQLGCFAAAMWHFFRDDYAKTACWLSFCVFLLMFDVLERLREKQTLRVSNNIVLDDSVLSRSFSRIAERRLREPLSDDAVEEYIDSLEWGDDTTGLQRTLVAGNIRGFAAHVLNKLEGEGK